MTTLLVTPPELLAEAVEVRGDAYRHLFRARRLRVGEGLRVVDGQGRARQGTVAEVAPARALIALGGAAPAHEPALRLDLLVAAPRPQLAAWLVEKATEIGVVAVRFLATERDPRTYNRPTMDRLRRLAAAAVEQCGRASLPEVTGVHRWEELERLLAGARRRLVLDLGGSAPPALTEGPAALAVGPEGGWSDAERRTLAALGCRPVGLGPRTLRVETAAVVGAGLVLLAGLEA